ncbi:hypothetical protein M5J13_00415 [Buchnera aphidicola (Periphyllus lyropictus)]|nr:hypothetical protein M5J13_00415 [Buchnera aphidicola (Periphyllus lyropictus)]
MLGNILKRFLNLNNLIDIDTLFHIFKRGVSFNKKLTYLFEITKWFNTNYNYIVPKFNENIKFFYGKKY